MYVDTHVHLNHRRYADDIAEVVDRARAAGVMQMLVPAIDVDSIARALDLADQFDGLFAMAGIHPTHTQEAGEDDFERVVELAGHDSVVAIGESGLDHYWDRSFDDVQEDYLRRHVRLAIETDLPLVLHNREASADLLRVVADERSRSRTPERLRGVFHCFSGPPDVGRAATELGFFLGIGGNVTFKNSATREALAGIDRSRMLLETDGPFLAPVPHRGKRNEPAHIPLIADVIATELGVAVAEVAEVTTENARRLFNVS